MTKSTVTVVLSGEVLLSDFAAGMERFRALIDAIGREVAGGVGIDWRVDDLAPGSALTSIRGIARRERDQPRVGDVIEAYGRVGEALESGNAVPYPRAIVKAATDLVGVINERVESIRLETEDQDWTISQAGQVAADGEGAPMEPAFGAVEGRVQTLSSRGGLRFTLYDTLYDKAVSCYLAEGYEDIMRDAWGHLAVAEGVVKRDPRSGRPLTVRQVRAVELLPEAGPDDYKKARGLIPLSPDSPRPEEVIRKARDA